MRRKGIRKDPGCSWVEIKDMVYVFYAGEVGQCARGPEVVELLRELEVRMEERGYVGRNVEMVADETEKGMEDMVGIHSERLALGFGLVSVSKGMTIRVMKNLRMCKDCHERFKMISDIVGRDFVVRDLNRFHHFKAGFFIENGIALIEQAAVGERKVSLEGILQLYDEFSAYISYYFNDNTAFYKALAEAFEVLCNKAKCGMTTAEMLSRFVHNILKKGNGRKKLSDPAIKEKLEKMSKLVSYIHEKDLFVEFHRKNLALRLLHDKNSNMEHESYFALQHKTQNGDQLTSKIKNMAHGVEVFKEFYVSQNKKKKLTWSHFLGNGSWGLICAAVVSLTFGLSFRIQLSNLLRGKRAFLSLLTVPSMDLIEINYNDEVLNQEQGCSAETSADYLLSLGSSERLQLSCTSVDITSVIAADCSISMGLVIPVMWSCCLDEHNRHEQQENLGTAFCAAVPGSMEHKNYGENLICLEGNKMAGILPLESNSHASLSQGTAFKFQCSEGTSIWNKELGECVRQESKTAAGDFDVCAPLWQPGKAKGCCPLPGKPSTLWTFAESQSFLLGLYIFGKNLDQIRKFMGNKDMGDVLSYYYGKFYKSDAHRRWTESRKIRSRRCVHGARILTGWRQQELLSRLLPSISKDVQDTLLEAIKAFNEGRVSLEELVLSLKTMVSMEVLVQAVGIGQGKRDLTRVVLDPTKTNQTTSIRSDLPSGKACSSLTAEDIVKFLTGNFRLSKARSNDLFWEAVWPRLLARGWHSEQPKDPVLLVKGDHYFDSVSDVLNKVASDPSLIELEIEGSNASGNIKDEDGWDADTQMKQNSLSDHQRHCYLLPRVSNTSEIMKFTIVDTSLDPGMGPKKVRELRSLPVDARQFHSPPVCSPETDSDSSSDQSESADLPLNDEDFNPGISESTKMGNKRISSINNGQFQSDVSDHMSAVSKQRMPVNGHDSNGQLDEFFDEKQSFKVMKSQSSWQHDYLAPAVKRRRLTACKQAESKHHTSSFPQGYQVKKEEIAYESKPLKPSESINGGAGPSRMSSFYSFPRGHHVKKEETSCELKSLERTESMSTVAADPSRRKFSISFPEMSTRYIPSGTFSSNTSSSSTVPFQEKPQAQTLIDLNVPYLPPDIKTEEQDQLHPVESSSTSETKQQLEGLQASDTSNDLIGAQPSTINGRRHSTRSRPLTTKVLEAWACGYLSSSNRKGRGGKASPSRSSRRARRNVVTPVSAPTDPNFSSPGLVSDVEMKDEYPIYTNQANMFSECPDQAKGKSNQELLQAFCDFD
ncbi:hypothetical protein J5N97_018175 [Dioscorea zingiberensis]|uniref:SANT domain-containing protein n=1 Tax=Dioscorea zingiberensis TaxID=325984 RepID=A0A9D5CQ68_9LILI|nr:hypothetical protein J5N97_018175 [Dioscorea zingiberensis]